MNQVRCGLVLLVVAVMTSVLVIPLLLVAVLKRVVPGRRARRDFTRLATRIARFWIALVTRTFDAAYTTRYTVSGKMDFDRRKSYLLIANHQSWVDVPVLLQVFRNRVPFYRFFLKKELLWFPLVGVACWALEYPFITFYSREELENDPEKRKKRLETARRACERARGIPVTITTFPEGAVFTPARQKRRSDGFRNVLRPRAGGLAMAVNAIGDQVEAVIDVTIRYPHSVPGMWDFLGNRIPEAEVHVRKIPLPETMIGGDYESDPEYRKRFRQWLNDIWSEKDARIERMAGS